MRRHSSPYSPDRLRQRGYALLLMLVLVTMGILFTLISQLSAVGMKWSRAQGGTIALNQAKEALIGYAVTYRDTHSGDVFGYLPCPDITGDGSADALSSDCGGTDGKAVIGLLPYKQLGLASNQDADGNCLWYAVSGTFKASASSTSPYNLPMPMNWDTQGQIEIRDANDNILATPDDINGGAAAVIFSVGPPVILSVGPPIVYQSRLAGTSTNPCGVSAAAKANAAYTNYIDVDPTGNDHTKSQPFPGAANGTVRVTQGISGSSVNNDQIAWVTPKEIFSRIVSRADFKNALGDSMPGQINTLANEAKVVIEKAMQNDLLATGSPTGPAQPNQQSGYSQFSGKQIGDLPALTLNNNSYQSYFGNWSDQFRYVACSNLAAATPCLTIAGTACRGALMFGGQSASGGPRPSTQKPPAVLPSPPNTYLANYFESGGGLNILSSSSTSFSGQTTYSAPNNAITRYPTAYSDPYNVSGDRALDTATCVFPGSFVSFAKDIGKGSFTAQHTSLFNPEAVVNTGSITLGNPGAWTSGSGCVWDINPLPFSTNLRAYFNFNILNKGQGFVFALLDAATNSFGPQCGATSGSRLGYTGNPTYPTYPKIGLEIDTSQQSSRNDPSGNHYDFLFWGTAASSSDDNTHNVGTAGSGIEPLNPTSSLSSSSCVQSAFWLSKVATVTTATNHGLVSGQQVRISGVTPDGYNGTYSISVVDNTHISYSLTSNPGTYTSGGSASSAILGLSNLTTCDPYLPHSSWPTNTVIQVRLDITKSYDATAHHGTFTLKAYIADTLSDCTLANYQDLSRNMEDICSQPPSIEQDNILMDDVTGEALANLYAGFTNSQTTSTEQTVTISNFLIRSQ